MLPLPNVNYVIYAKCYVDEMLPISIYQMLTIPNIIYVKCYLYQMLTVPNVHYTKCDLCKMLPRRNFTSTKMYYWKRY